MKSLIFLTLLFSTTAFAQDYVCDAVANPNRGFKDAFTIEVQRLAVGGPIKMLVGGVSKWPNAVVTEIVTLDKSNPDHRQAFELTLGMLHESDVSGLTDLAAVTSLTMIKITGDHSIFRFFADTQQVGGSFLSKDALATACLPHTEAPKKR